MASVESAALGWWPLLLLGVCAGVLSGMLGVGSGTLVIPALVLLFAVPQKSAQGMCLAAMVPMALVGAIRYKLDPTIEVDMARAALIALGGVAGAFVGVEIATRLPGSVLRRIFACFMIAVGLRMLLSRAPKKATGESVRVDAPAVSSPASLDDGTVLPRRVTSWEEPGAARKGNATNDDAG